MVLEMECEIGGELEAEYYVHPLIYSLGEERT